MHSKIKGFGLRQFHKYRMPLDQVPGQTTRYDSDLNDLRRRAGLMTMTPQAKKLNREDLQVPMSREDLISIIAVIQNAVATQGMGDLNHLLRRLNKIPR